MFSDKDISDYYQHTRVHYVRFWKLNEVKALHYGFWEKDTKNLSQALKNVNDAIIEFAGINARQTILDAGCGIGGTSIYIANRTNCKAVGITLNEQQKRDADANALALHVEDKCTFHVMNFCNTAFENESFDTVFGVESICHATEKKDFLTEAFRLLKPGGTLVFVDYCKEENLNVTQEKFLQKWLHAWAIKDIDSLRTFCTKAKAVGFKNIKCIKKTKEIRKSSWMIYLYSLLGTIPSKLYGLYNRNATPFGKSHTKAGIVQYQALKKNLWNYYIITAKK